MLYAVAIFRGGWVKLVAALLLLACSYAAFGATYYGAPYKVQSIYGNGSFGTVGEAVNFLVDKMTAPCAANPECTSPPQITVSYGTSSTAAVVSVNGGTIRQYVAASIYNVGQPQKNLGGCQRRCSAGLGSERDGTGARGSINSAVEVNAEYPGSPFEGDPINASTGNFYRQETDYRSPSGLMFRRFYNSSDAAPASQLGAQWRHIFDRRLNVLLSNTGVAGAGQYIEAIRPDGGSERFTLGTAGWQSASDVSDVLVERDSGAGYALQLSANRQVELYSPSGLLEEVRDASGRVLYSLEYSTVETLSDVAPTTGLLLVVGDTHGRKLAFSYDGQSRLIKVALPDGGDIRYAYDVAGYLAEITYPDGATIGYLYNEADATGGVDLPGAMTGIVDADGLRYETIKYNKSRRAYSVSFADGIDETIIKYSASTQNNVLPSSVAGPLGGGTSFKFIDVAKGRLLPAGGSTPCGTQCNQPWKTMTYDANGYPASTVDFKGNAVSTVYTSDGLLSQRIDAVGTPQQRTMLMTWDSVERVPLVRKVLDAAGAEVQRTVWRYNSNGQQTARCEVDPSKSNAAGYACGASSSAPSGVRQRLTSYCDAVDDAQCPILGLVLHQSGPRIGVDEGVTYRYYMATDESGCGSLAGACHRAGDLYQAIDAFGRAHTFAAYDLNGRVARTIDVNGLVRDMTYTARGWVSSVSLRANADGSPSDRDQVVSMEYDASGNVSKTTDPDGSFLIYGYDAAHRLVAVSDGMGNAIRYTLDAAGNRVKQDAEDPSGTLKRSMSRIYNKLGQMAVQANSGGDPTDYAYDENGNLETATDALGRVSTSDHDPLNRLAKVVQDLGGIAATSSFEYDALDNVTKVTDPKGLATTYAYNGFGELETLVSPDTGTTSFTYDEAGNVKTRTDARGVVTTYSYDALNRLLVAQSPDPASDVAYTYDVAPQACPTGETYPVGRVSTMTDGSGVTSYCYNAFGDVVRKVQTVNGQPLTVQYSYTAGGRLATMTYPDGALVDYVRNSLGQISEIGVTRAGSRTVLLAGAGYLPFGPSTGWTYGNGRALVRTFDQDYRPTGVADSLDELKVGLGYDPVGDLRALNVGDVPILLDYDALGRLTAFKDQASDSTIESYTYDATGNRLSFSNTSGTDLYDYPADSHRLASVAGIARTYDAAGSTTSIGGSSKEFVYDPRGRLSQVKLAGAVAQNYAYNGKGERVRRWQQGSEATLTAYNEAGQWLGDYDAQGLARQQAIWMDDMPVGLLADGQLYYIEPDHLGSPRLVVDPARNVPIWNWDLNGEAFGRTAPNEDPDGDGTPLVLDMRFPGQRFDAVSGLNYNYFRDFDASGGRYLESDPIGLSGGTSTYSYVSGMPIMAVDSLGLETCLLTTIGPGGIRDHSAIYTSRGDGAGKAALYDPAGSYGAANGGGSSGIVIGDAANIAKFRNFHGNQKTESICKDTSQEEEEKIINNAMDLPSAAPFQCAIMASTVLGGLPSFPNVQAGTFFPGNLMRQFGGEP